MRHAGLAVAGESNVKLLVSFMDQALESDYRRIATQLRDAGISTELYLDADKLGKQIKYADRTGIPYVLVMGGDERAKGVIALKHLASGEQKEIPLTTLAASIKDILSQR